MAKQVKEPVAPVVTAEVCKYNIAAALANRAAKLRSGEIHL